MPERLADLLLEELRDRAAVHAAQDLAVDVAVVQRVVGRALADREHRHEIGDAATHAVPVGQPFRRVADRRLRNAGLVGQGHAQRRVLFAVRAELGPHLDDRHVVAEPVLLDAEVQARGRDALRRRREHEQGVAVDRLAGGGIGHAGPRVDDELAVEVGGHLQADFGSVLDERGEDGAHPLVGVARNGVRRARDGGQARRRGRQSETAHDLPPGQPACR